MIEFLSGEILVKKASSLILNVTGIGYGISMPLSQLIQVGGKGTRLSLWIFTRVREDQLALFGFLKEEDRQVFEMLLSCNGIGPKVALAIMSTMTSSELSFFVREKNYEAFELVPGIGKRTAEKLIVDLQTKVEKIAIKAPVLESSSLKPKGLGLKSAEEENLFPESFRQDLISALSNLGFKDKDIRPVLEDIVKTYEGEDFALVTRKALSLLSSGGSKKKPLQVKQDLEAIF